MQRALFASTDCRNISPGTMQIKLKLIFFASEVELELEKFKTFPDPDRDPEQEQNCFLGHASPLQKISSKSVHN